MENCVKGGWCIVHSAWPLSRIERKRKNRRWENAEEKRINIKTFAFVICYFYIRKFQANKKNRSWPYHHRSQVAIMLFAHTQHTTQMHNSRFRNTKGLMASQPKLPAIYDSFIYLFIIFLLLFPFFLVCVAFFLPFFLEILDSAQNPSIKQSKDSRI